MTTSVLIVDDEPLVRWSIASELEERGYAARQAATGVEARRQLSGVGAVVLDYALPDVDGFELLEQIASEYPTIPVLMLTGHGSIRHAVDAMRQGAWHYLHKPFDIGELCGLVDRAVEASGEVVTGEETAAAPLLGGSARMSEVRRQLVQAARSPSSTLLLTGETGTGKDLAARVVHRASLRGDGAFVHVTCSALPATLLESELFGHEAGAFTGAVRQRVGLFEQADGGTVFLDEIGELTPALQAKLLRFLEDKALRRLGGTEEIQPDVRVIAATHVDLERAVEDGRFRRDLFYRLAVLEITMPPLRDRSDDVPVLAQDFLGQLGRSELTLTREAEAKLKAHTWPGNVRELRNVIERATTACSGKWVPASELVIRERKAKRSPLDLPPEGLDLPAFEKHLLREALERTGGNRTRAAALLGLTRDTVRYRIAKYGWDED